MLQIKIFNESWQDENRHIVSKSSFFHLEDLPVINRVVVVKT